MHKSTVKQKSSEKDALSADSFYLNIERNCSNSFELICIIKYLTNDVYQQINILKRLEMRLSYTTENEK